MFNTVRNRLRTASQIQNTLFNQGKTLNANSDVEVNVPDQHMGSSFDVFNPKLNDPNRNIYIAPPPPTVMPAKAQRRFNTRQEALYDTKNIDPDYRNDPGLPGNFMLNLRDKEARERGETMAKRSNYSNQFDIEGEALNYFGGDDEDTKPPYPGLAFNPIPNIYNIDYSKVNATQYNPGLPVSETNKPTFPSERDGRISQYTGKRPWMTEHDRRVIAGQNMISDATAQRFKEQREATIALNKGSKGGERQQYGKFNKNYTNTIPREREDDLRIRMNPHNEEVKLLGSRHQNLYTNSIQNKTHFTKREEKSKRHNQPTLREDFNNDDITNTQITKIGIIYNEDGSEVRRVKTTFDGKNVKIMQTREFFDENINLIDMQTSNVIIPLTEFPIDLRQKIRKQNKGIVELNYDDHMKINNIVNFVSTKSRNKQKPKHERKIKLDFSSEDSFEYVDDSDYKINKQQFEQKKEKINMRNTLNRFDKI